MAGIDGGDGSSIQSTAESDSYKVEWKRVVRKRNDICPQPLSSVLWAQAAIFVCDGHDHLPAMLGQALPGP